MTPTISITPSRIREEFGTSPKTFYDETGRQCYYSYNKGLIYDTWWLDDQKFSSDLFNPISYNHYMSDISINHYYNTNKPPIKPGVPQDYDFNCDSPIPYILNCIKYKYNEARKKIQDIYYKPDGTTIDYTIDYDPQTGKSINQTNYKSDGKTKDVIFEFNQTGQKTKKINYKSDGQTIDSITESDPKTGKKANQTYYHIDGSKTIEEFSPQTGRLIKTTYHHKDGSKFITDFDQTTSKQIRYTQHNKDGLLWYTYNYDPQTANRTKYTHYKPDGKTVYYIIEFNRETSNQSELTEFDSKTGNKIKYTKYYEDGKQTKYTIEFNYQTKKPNPRNSVQP
ncbi:DUF2963 domain-containing protein [Candidatus Phytoplasma australiense]|uniref:DUF2963 domain-containing protein n=1 Tax=Strawberry lethal yellows phytoplasma (CPA) str. NZSb11 TaxID=980422 RepID=R4RNR3_PHYAS|nr:DUF2963 domain-containing protein [Candidatus Phytoplasma australiense]AGL91015.1 Hypothetical Protein SLY_1109 [Strawberry lethal yellows phytoplasma (CPA) str. NZSb11]